MPDESEKEIYQSCRASSVVLSAVVLGVQQVVSCTCFVTKIDSRALP